MPTNTGDRKSPDISCWKQSRQLTLVVAPLFSDTTSAEARNHAVTPLPLHGGLSGVDAAIPSIHAAPIIPAPTELPETVDNAKMRLRTSPGLPVGDASISAPTTVAV